MKYCLVGIKGVAMSGLAKILLMDEHIVEGIDVNDDYYTIENLKGIKLYDFKNYELNRDFTYIIGNSFQNHKIVSEIQKSQYSFEFYPKFVSKYFEKYDMIAISGTHGKTRLKGQRKYGVKSRFFRLALFYFSLKMCQNAKKRP